MTINTKPGRKSTQQIRLHLQPMNMISQQNQSKNTNPKEKTKPGYNLKTNHEFTRIEEVNKPKSQDYIKYKLQSTTK